MLIRRIKNPSPVYRRKRTLKRFSLGVLVLIVGIIVWVSATGLIAMRNITAQNNSESPSFFRFAGEVPPDQLSAEGDGRVNILLIGIGGAGHPGGYLADTIQIVSLDPINKTMGMLSLPRDLYVPIPGNGSSKINAVYSYGLEKCRKAKNCNPNSDAGADALKETVATVLDVPIHYFARVDFEGFEKFVDAVGGIQIYVDKPLNDPLFPDDQLKGYEPLYIPAGMQKFDGELALKYARSRHGTNGEGSDFARAARQQKVIKAIQDKTLSLNILANPKKVTDLINILGNHLKTDMGVDELRRLAVLAKAVDSNSLTTEVLDTSASGPLKSLNDPKAGYIIVPKKGNNDFTEVREFALTVLKEPYLVKEGAKVVVANASGKSGVAADVSAKLKSLGYNVVDVTTAESTLSQTTVTTFSDKPYTASLLKKRFKANEQKGKSGVNTSGEDILLTIGSSYKK